MLSKQGVAILAAMFAASSWQPEGSKLMLCSSTTDVFLRLQEVVKQGKVKYIGVSEMPADMIRKAHAIHPLSCVEMEWNLFTRDSERDLLPTCRELGIGILAYSPMGRGALGIDLLYWHGLP